MNEDKRNPSGPPPNAPSQIRSESKPFENELLGLLNILIIMRERIWWALLAAFALVGSWLFYTYTQPSLYAGNASIIVENRSDKVVDIQQVVDPVLQNEKELLNYEEQMRSRRFREYAAAGFTPEERTRLLAPYLDESGKAPEVVSFYGERNVKIKRTGQVFKISVLHRDPECAALLANRYVERYVAFQIDRADSSNSSAMKFLEDQVAELKKRVEHGEAALQAYRAKYNMVSLEDSQNLVVGRMKQLSEALTIAQVEKLTVDSQVAQIDSIEKSGDYLRLLDVPAVHSFPGIMGTFDSLDESKAKRAQLGAVYKSLHPRMVEIDAQIAKQSENLKNSIGMAVAGVRHHQAELKARLTQIEAELARAEKDALNLDRMAIDYNVLRRQLDTDKQTFEQMLSRRNDTAISSRLANTNVRILDLAEAVEGDPPAYPNTLTVIGITLLLFVVGMMGVPYFVDLLDNRLKAGFDIEVFLHKPMLGDLPFFRNAKRQDLCTAVIKDNDTDLVEMFRAVFAAINLQTDDKPGQVFLVTSTVPAEGKTYFASNLAGVFARHGSRTLIMDCDFRGPALHSAFSVKPEKGLVDYLAASPGEMAPLNGHLPDLGIVQVAAGCHLLPAGRRVNNATELFDSRRFAELMQRLRKEYDTIIIDTPPVGVFPDAMFLAHHADHTIYIARFNLLSRMRIKHMIDDMDGTPAKVIGVVINGRDSRKGVRYGYGYNYSRGHYYANGYNYYDYDRRKYRRHYATTDSSKGEDKKG
jgi:capsular exopolysaccharide synthesis family protein